MHAAAHALHRVFIHFMETGELAQLKVKKLKGKVFAEKGKGGRGVAPLRTLR